MRDAGERDPARLRSSPEAGVYIDNDPLMEQVCDEARYHRRLGIDLEFLRERTYTPRLALVQIAVGDALYLIDPLGDVDLAPLLSVLRDPDVCKVLHASKQDLEILADRIGGHVPNVFDTQIAAAVLGMGNQIAYSALVFKVLGVEVSASQSLTDWLKRPLTEDQERYALDDVRHLFALQAKLSKRLERLGRTAAFEEECAKLERVTGLGPSFERMHEVVKGRGRLNSRGLAVLRELSAWREAEARSLDVPRRRVVSDEVLVEVARREPRSLKQLKTIRLLHRGDLKRFGEALLHAVKLGRETPPEAYPKQRSSAPVPSELRPTIDVLKFVLKIQCEQVDIAAGLVANSSDIERLVAAVYVSGEDLETQPVLRGWRGELVGRRLMEVMEGGVGVRLNPDSGAPEFFALDEEQA